jgi:hypothetical protein
VRFAGTPALGKASRLWQRANAVNRAGAITDLEVRFHPVKKFELALGADNVFDDHPDRSPFGPRPASIGGTIRRTRNIFRSRFSRRSASTAATCTAGQR